MMMISSLKEAAKCMVTAVNHELPQVEQKGNIPGDQFVAIMHTLYNWTITTTGVCMNL